MIQRFNLCNIPMFRSVICFSSTLSLLLLTGSLGWADDSPAYLAGRLSRDIQIPLEGERVYTPPVESRTSEEDHTGGGVRGCGDDLAALAPRLNDVGQTVSTRPTFVWYGFGDDADPLEFHLYRYQSDGSVKAVLIDPIGPSNEGYMAYTFPPNEPELTVGDTYLWQVVLYCDQNLEEIGRWTSADIEIVAPPRQPGRRAAQWFFATGPSLRPVWPLVRCDGCGLCGDHP